MKIYLIAESIPQLPNIIQCTPTYCNLEPSSSRIPVGLRNASAKITLPAQTVICQVKLANMVTNLCSTGTDVQKAVKKRICYGY